MSIVKRFLAMCMALAACLAAAVCMAPRAAAGQRFTIAYTGGIGVYPRSGPSMSSQHAGAALPEGSSVDVACELEGELVDNNTTPATKIWERLSDGTHIPNAYINSGADGWTPGVPRCEKSESERKKDKDPTIGVITKGPRTGGERLYISYNPNKGDMQVAIELFSHYFRGDGVDTYIDWEFFKNRQHLKEFAYTIKKDGFDKYQSTELNDGNSPGLMMALGTFTVYRISDHCFLIYDYYDFDQASVYSSLHNAAREGKAKEFNVFSYGCYSGGGGGGGGGW